MRRVVHFEIHAENVERASKFYKSIFGWNIKQWGEMPYWMVMTSDQKKNKKKEKWPGIDGGMVIRKGASPKDGQPLNAYVCTIDVDDIDAYMKKVVNAGGRIVVPKRAIP